MIVESSIGWTAEWRVTTCRVTSWLLLSLGFAYLFGAPADAQIDAVPADQKAVCRMVGEKESGLLSVQLPEGFASDISTIRELVEKLRDELDLPISFIEHRPNESIHFLGNEQTLEEILRATINQQELYRCEVHDGRLVLRSSDALFDVTISGVDLVEKYHLAAKGAYVRHLRGTDLRFEHWFDLVAIAGEGPDYDGRVTLSREASVVQHFAQLLGRDPALYFDVPAISSEIEKSVAEKTLAEKTGWRSISLNRVNRPWERQLIDAQKKWAKVRQEMAEEAASTSDDADQEHPVDNR